MKRRSRPNIPGEVPGESLGRRLSSLRESQGIEIERAAHETRIRASCLREIEADDFTRLPSAYARMVLRNYARYLGMREEELAADLPEATGFGVEGYEYIRNAPGNEGYAPPAHSPARRVAVRPRRSRKVLVFAPLVAVVALFAGFQLWSTIRKLDRIQQSPEPPVTSAVQSRVSPEQEVLTFRAVGESDNEWLLVPGSAIVGENPAPVPAAQPVSENL